MIADRPAGRGRAWRWRALWLGLIGLTSLSLVGVAVYATFTTSVAASQSITAGVVNLGLNEPSVHTCEFPMLMPGDLSGITKCAMSVKYAGNVDAFISLSVAIQSSAGLGGSLLYDGSNTNGLNFVISDGVNSFRVPTSSGTNGGSCPSGYTCWSAPFELAAWYSGSPATTPNLVFTDAHQSITWTVTPTFPSSAGNGYQGSSAKLILSAQAVNGLPLPATCNASTIGQSCPSRGDFAWS